MKRHTLKIAEITEIDLNLARNEKVLAAAQDIYALPPEERLHRFNDLQEKIQQGKASLFEEKVLVTLLERRGAERILAIHRNLPKIEQAHKSRSGSSQIVETSSPPSSEPQPSSSPPETYPSELLEFLATQKPPTSPTARPVTAQRTTQVSSEVSSSPGWTIRDRIIVAGLVVLLGVALGYGFMRDQSSSEPLLTFAQQAAGDADLSPHEREQLQQLQAEFDGAMQALRMGDFEDGEKRMLTFIETHSNSSQAETGYVALADTYRQRRNDPDQALVYYQQFLERYPESSRTGLVQLKMGFAYEDQEDQSNAEAMYRLILQHHGSQSRIGQLANERLQALINRP